MTSSSSPEAAAAPPWMELPREITTAIFHKLGAIELLMSIQLVCKAWFSVCLDPSLWRSIRIRESDSLRELPFDEDKLCRNAVDRSQGQLTDIYIENFCTNKLLSYISRRCIHLRCLQLENCDRITSRGLFRAVKNLPLLEELHLYCTYISSKAIESIGRSCPVLKSFTYNKSRHSDHLWDFGNDARAIAENMPELRQLHLFGNEMTNEGLQGILDGCPHLETLDLRHCFNLDFNGELDRLCKERIKDLKRPYDSTHDYPFDIEFYDGEALGDDIMDMVPDDDGYY